MKVKFVELHLLQSFPPSCVNRDGNNSPKDCVFGGIRRARISSQCLKRAIRQADTFKETLGEETATRSKQMRDKKLIPYLKSKGLSQDEAAKAADSFRTQLSKNDKKEEQTAVGLYFRDDELFALLDAFRNEDPKWKQAGRNRSADVALFGRMLAEATDLGVDAAAQVAHAISTHKISQELDYWTAADDLKDKSSEDAGAGMLGAAEFNASVFYRYACVSVPILEDNLKDESLARKTVEAFLRASWDAIPTGKVNGHAHFVNPSFALVASRRKGMPMNLCNAFQRPITPKGDQGIDSASAAALLNHLKGSVELAPNDDATYRYATSLDLPETETEAKQLRGYGDLISETMGDL